VCPDPTGRALCARRLTLFHGANRAPYPVQLTRAISDVTSRLFSDRRFRCPKPPSESVCARSAHLGSENGDSPAEPHIARPCPTPDGTRPVEEPNHRAA